MLHGITTFIAKRRWLKRILMNQLDEHSYLDLERMRLYYDPKDLRGPSFHVVYSDNYGYEHYEKKDKDLLVSLMPLENGVFFDIGANIGLFTYYLNQNCRRMTAHCFEPHPTLAKCMRMTNEANSYKNIHINEVGLSDVEGEFKLYLSPINAGGHSLSNSASDKSDDNFTMVQVTTIDKYCSDNHIEKIDVVKMDVEGVEPQVLVGALETFRKYKPALLIECMNEDLIKGEAVLKTFKENNLPVKFCTAFDSTLRDISEIGKHAQSLIEQNIMHDNYVFKFM